MRRTVLTTALILGVAGVALVGAAIAQSNPVVERSALMQAAGAQFYGVINRMARGALPFEQAKADAAFAVIESLSQKTAPLFLANSTEAAASSRYHSSPKIWENKKDFDDRFIALSKAIAENKSKTGTIDELKIAAAAVGGVCNGCHEVYQVKN